MGKRNRVTTRDIAEYTGVSQSTVSMILSERKGVSFMPETRQKVMEAAKKLGYKKPEKRDWMAVVSPLMALRAIFSRSLGS